MSNSISNHLNSHKLIVGLVAAAVVTTVVLKGSSVAEAASSIFSNITKEPIIKPISTAKIYSYDGLQSLLLAGALTIGVFGTLKAIQD